MKSVEYPILTLEIDYPSWSNYSKLSDWSIYDGFISIVGKSSNFCLSDDKSIFICVSILELSSSSEYYYIF